MIDFNYTAPELLPFRIQEVLDAPNEPHRIGGVVYVPEGGVECEDVSIKNGIFKCSECGCTVEEDGVDWGEIHYCPDCGKRVE